MKDCKFFNLLVTVCLMVVVTLPLFADENFGCRIPTTYFATSGVGQSDEGIPPDPYETFSYDLALQAAGIENFNVVYYTSVLPPESYEVSIDIVKPYFKHGAVLESIMAKAGGYRGDTVAAGVGRIWAIDSKGSYVGGFAAEYERIYDRQQVSSEQAEKDAVEQLTKSLQHELNIRGLTQKGEMKFTVTSLYIEKKYGIALAALGFVNFIYPGPLQK
ncbi:MAG: pyruvoyl-dependent arginine decarboxylase [Candidatus Aminicenantes bacterium]|jgi:arginine decarboxylase